MGRGGGGVGGGGRGGEGEVEGGEEEKTVPSAGHPGVIAVSSIPPIMAFRHPLIFSPLILSWPLPGSSDQLQRGHWG